jgi:hypothetical protein
MADFEALAEVEADARAEAGGQEIDATISRAPSPGPEEPAEEAAEEGAEGGEGGEVKKKKKKKKAKKETDEGGEKEEKAEKPKAKAEKAKGTLTMAQLKKVSHPRPTSGIYIFAK